jgi:hydrogenase expression/formation protein HypC
MCIGIPMRVTSLEPGHAWATGRGERRRVNLALVGDVALGEWLLVFLDAAREKVSAQRAAEVNGALDLLDAALAGDLQGAQGALPFDLPSRIDPSALRALSGSRAPEEAP